MVAADRRRAPPRLHRYRNRDHHPRGPLPLLTSPQTNARSRRYERLAGPQRSPVQACRSGRYARPTPMISTFCPACTFPRRTACKAVSADTGTAAACSKDRFAGLAASRPRLSPGARSEGAVAGAADVIARLELRDVRASGLDRPGQAPAWVAGLGRAEPEGRQAHRVGQACHQMPGAPVHAGSTYVYENLVVCHRWPGDFGEPQHLLGGGAVFILHDGRHRLHAVRRWWFRRLAERCFLHGFPAFTGGYRTGWWSGGPTVLA